MPTWNFFHIFFVKKYKALSVAFLLVLVFSCSFFFFSPTVFAQGVSETDTFGINPLLDEEEGLVLGSGDIRIVIAQIIRIFLGLLGVIVVSLIIYAGFLWMTANGNEDNISRAKKILTNSVIGLVIILSAFTITQFIINALANATGFGIGTGIRGGGGRQEVQSFAGTGSLGRVVRDHYPFRNQDDVKRNSKIIVTFSTPVDPSSIIENTNQTCWPQEGTTPVSMTQNAEACLRDAQNNIVEYYGDCLPSDNEDFDWSQRCDHLNTDAVSIFPSNDTNQRVQAAAMTMYEGEDLQPYTFVFRPFSLLGDTVAYTVRLTDGILAADGQTSVFAQQRFSYYSWEFSTASDIDFSPPTVVSTFPSFSRENETIARNAIVQITFSEAMDPLTVAGVLSASNGSFSNIIFNTTNVGAIPAADYLPNIQGEWQISNAYRTVEFIPKTVCGTNTCNEPIYCFDAPLNNQEEEYHVLLRTAQPIGNDPEDFSSLPFSGISDISGNALDGDGDGIRDGKPIITHPYRISIPGVDAPLDAIDERRADNFYWSFLVNDTIDTDPPYITKISPGIDQEDVVEFEDVRITFSKPMLSRTLHDISIIEYPDTLIDDSFWYRSRFSTDADGRTIAEIDHRAFGPSGLDLYYFPQIPSTVRGLNQSCLYPGRGPIGFPATQRNVAPVCVFDENQNQNCVSVTFDELADTGCIQTTNQELVSLTQPDIASCILQLQREEVSPTNFIPEN